MCSVRYLVCIFCIYFLFLRCGFSYHFVGTSLYCFCCGVPSWYIALLAFNEHWCYFLLIDCSLLIVLAFCMSNFTCGLNYDVKVFPYFLFTAWFNRHKNSSWRRMTLVMQEMYVSMNFKVCYCLWYLFVSFLVLWYL